MRQISLFFIMVFSCISTYAQADLFAGFYDGSRHEMVFKLYIMPNHEFVITQIYGAEDRLVIGSWKEIGSQEILLQENRSEQEPFVVYVANGERKGRQVDFQYFDQNTLTAFGSGSPFDARKLKYIHKPGAYSFSRRNLLELSEDSSKIVYLSRPLTETQQEVYAFDLGANDRYVSLMYNAKADQDRVEIKAILKEDGLYFSGITGKAERVGSRQALPDDYEKGLAQLKTYDHIPDSLMMETDGEERLFKRIRSKPKFEVNAKLDREQAYFYIEEADEVIIPAAPPFPKKDQ